MRKVHDLFGFLGSRWQVAWFDGVNPRTLALVLLGCWVMASRVEELWPVERRFR